MVSGRLWCGRAVTVYLELKRTRSECVLYFFYPNDRSERVRQNNKRVRSNLAIECLRRSNQQRVGSLWAQIWGVAVPLGVDPWCLGLQGANIPG